MQRRFGETRNLLYILPKMQGYLVPGTQIALYIRPFVAVNPIALIRSFGDTNGREALPAGE